MSPPERARKNESTILQAMAAMGQAELAKAMAVHESTVSRFKESGIGTFSTALAYLGLKCVPVGMACFDPTYVEALKTLAEVGIRQAAPQLVWSESA